MNGYLGLLLGLICLAGLPVSGFVLWAICAVGSQYDERMEKSHGRQ